LRCRKREEIGSHVARVLLGQTQVGHHGHVLHLELGAVIGTSRMQLSIKQVRQIVFGVISRRQIAMLFGAVRRVTLARVVNPAHDVVIVGLLSDSRANAPPIFWSSSPIE